MKTILINKTTVIADCHFSGTFPGRKVIDEHVCKRFRIDDASNIHYYQVSSIDPCLIVASLKKLTATQAQSYARVYVHRQIYFS